MKLLLRARHLVSPPSNEPRGAASWEPRFTPEQHLRANSALGSIEIDVLMEKKDDAQIVGTAKLLLRGINRMRWSDPNAPAV